MWYSIKNIERHTRKNPSGHGTDKGVIMNKRMILFDVTPFTKKKRIHIIPYKEISSATIEFDLGTSAILLSIDSGYQIRLNFVHMHADEKTRLRLLFLKMMKDQK